MGDPLVFWRRALKRAADMGYTPSTSALNQVHFYFKNARGIPEDR